MVCLFLFIFQFQIQFKLGGKPIEEFCGLRAKMYSVKSPNQEKKAAKGVSGKQSHLISYSHFIN